jgi:hypothetical protein
MAGHDRKKQVRSANVGRRLLVGMGASAGVFFAAAEMATDTYRIVGALCLLRPRMMTVCTFRGFLP